VFRTLVFAFLALIWAAPGLAGEMDFQEADSGVELAEFMPSANALQTPRLRSRSLGMGLALGGPGRMQLTGSVGTGVWLLASGASILGGVVLGAIFPAAGALGAILGAGLTVGFMTDARPGWTTLGALIGLVVAMPIVLIVALTVVASIMLAAVPDPTAGGTAPLGTLIVAALVLWSVPALFMGAGASIAGNKDMNKQGVAKLGPTMVRGNTGKFAPGLGLTMQF